MMGENEYPGNQGMPQQEEEELESEQKELSGIGMDPSVGPQNVIVDNNRGMMDQDEHD